MVIAYHSIFTAYGFWLPNDPRGSYCDFVAAWELVLAAGKATKVATRQSVAARASDHAARLAAKEALLYPPVSFTPAQIEIVAAGFADADRKSGYVVHACSILLEHVHRVTARHRWEVERVVGHFKTEGTMRLVKDRLHPFQDLQRPGGRLVSCWAEKSWNVYLDSPADVRRAVEYVRHNPLKEGRPAQSWAFERDLAGEANWTRPDERAG